MVKAIAVNGRQMEVVNTLSSGPGNAPHTYCLKGGSYVYEIAGQWFLQVRGQFKQPVAVGL